MRIFKLTLLVAVLALFVVIAVSNTSPVEVGFLAWSTKMSLAFPLIAAYLLGGLTARPVLRLFRSWRRDAQHQRRIRRESRPAGGAAAANRSGDDAAAAVGFAATNAASPAPADTTADPGRAATVAAGGPPPGTEGQ